MICYGNEAGDDAPSCLVEGPRAPTMPRGMVEEANMSGRLFVES